MERYKALSQKIMGLLRDFSPRVEPVSIDEAYVDITGCNRLYGKPREVAARIKQKVKETVNLTCSVGIGPNKLIAKIASDMNKPDGLTIIMPDQVPEFLKNLAINKVPGVGRVRIEQLVQMGIKTLGDIQAYPQKTILNRFGKFGRRLLEISAGTDDAVVTPISQRKSVSTEETLLQDIDDKKLIGHYLLAQAETVARALRKEGVRAKTITLKLKHADFKQVTRSITLPVATQSSGTVFMAASKLLKTYPIKSKVRLIGVGASGLLPESIPVQMGLFEGQKKKSRDWEKVDKAVDSITHKYGKDVIKRGALKNEE